MRNNFLPSLKHVLKHEGGWVDHPKDPGGATMEGVTLATFQRMIKRDATKAQLRAITQSQLEVIYRRGYWDVVIADELPLGIDYAIFDYAVNSGPDRAVKALQKAVGVNQDGRIGPITLNAVAINQPSEIIERVCATRLAFLKRLKTWPTFGKGWGRRVADVKEVALAMSRQGADSARGAVLVSAYENVTYVNHNAIRNLPVTDLLLGMISNGLYKVYGEGYRAEIYSGGQPALGSGGLRTGSERHDNGKSGDIYIYAPDNTRLQGMQLAPFCQYWLAAGNGSCGAEMRGGGVHVDQWTTPPAGGALMWTYDHSNTKAYGAKLRAAMERGLKGVMPPLVPLKKVAPKSEAIAADIKPHEVEAALREDGSRTIANANEAKQTLWGKLFGAGGSFITAAVSQFAGMGWQSLIVIGIIGLIVFFYFEWKGQKALDRVKAARVDDALNGFDKSRIEALERAIVNIGGRHDK